MDRAIRKDGPRAHLSSPLRASEWCGYDGRAGRVLSFCILCLLLPSVHVFAAYLRSPHRYLDVFPATMATRLVCLLTPEDEEGGEGCTRTSGSPFHAAYLVACSESYISSALYPIHDRVQQ